MTTPADISGYVDGLVTTATARLQTDETLLAAFKGEHSDFVRFNQGRVRQAGSVQQLSADLDLIAGKRHTTASVQLSGVGEIDDVTMADTIALLREQRAVVPEDPYLLFNSEVSTTSTINDGKLLESHDAIDVVRSATSGHDMVGIYAAGRQFSGFASSLGQRDWHDSATFNLDWSLYLDRDKATKELYAGFDWDQATFERKVEAQGTQLEALARPAMDLVPNGYRTYLTPTALKEITDMLSWGGFSLRAHRTTDTPLLRMTAEGATLDASVTIREDTANGVSPRFQGQGFAKPDSVTLIEGGSFADHLVSPRSSVEYGVESNGAGGNESPSSISLAAGSIPAGEVLEHLGTGLYIGNLWYLNFSDRAACRTTGMTRFATFWVEGGEIVAPVNVLRFDDTAFRLLGDRLVGFTDTPEMLLDSLSYGARSTESARLPGALIEEMMFTL